VPLTFNLPVILVAFAFSASVVSSLTMSPPEKPRVWIRLNPYLMSNNPVFINIIEKYFDVIQDVRILLLLKNLQETS
jgi:hypothetical protein